MEVQWEAALSAVAGSGVMVKMYMQKCLKDLSSIVDKISAIQSELAAITVKLEAAERGDVTLREHDRKIAALEIVAHGKNSIFKRDVCAHEDDSYRPSNRSKNS